MPPFCHDEATIVPDEMTAHSITPAPRYKTKLPVVEETGIFAPIAAANGCSTRYACLAPACIAASINVLRSTCVVERGMLMITSGLKKINFPSERRKSSEKIASAPLKSETAPFSIGETAFIPGSSRPTSFFACSPTATIFSVSSLIATIEGISRINPFSSVNKREKEDPMSMARRLFSIFIFYLSFYCAKRGKILNGKKVYRIIVV